MKAQELMDAAELHRIKGKLWKSILLWEEIVHDFPGTNQANYAQEQLEKHARERHGFIVEAWRGHMPLGEVFWIYFALPMVGIYVLLYVLHALGATSLSSALFVLLVISWLPYQVWILVSLWRCAAKETLNKFPRIVSDL